MNKDRVDRARLRAIRKAQGISVRGMARRLEIGSGRYGNYESGTRRFPIDVLTDVADALGCSVDSLLARDQLIESEKTLT